jgi:integrase
MEVADVLRPIWNTRQATARRLRQRMERIFRYAKAGGLCTGDNPASLRDGLADLLTAGPIEERHHPALPYQRAGAFMAALAQRESTSARALAFVILTAVRTNEVLGATWREVDIEAREWTIPSERMKKVRGTKRREHRVPLSDAAVAILVTMKPMAAGPDSYIFPGERTMPGEDRRGPLSALALNTFLHRMNVAPKVGGPRPWLDRSGARVTVHGFRSTFRDWTSEATAFPHEVAEAALAHVVSNKVEAAYRRGDLFTGRRGGTRPPPCSTRRAPGPPLHLMRERRRLRRPVAEGAAETHEP